MGEQDPQRRAVRYRLDRLVEQDAPAADDGSPRPPGDGSAAGSAPESPRPRTMAARGAFADELVRQAIARGEFDDLPLRGKPIPGLSGRYDPDWWLKAFIEREGITGVLPEALQLRKDDAALEQRLDLLHPESRVREALEEFNARVVEARRQLLGGPPVVTPTRDVDLEVARWHDRRRRRADEAAAARAAEDARASADRVAARRRLPWRRPRRGPDQPHEPLGRPAGDG